MRSNALVAACSLVVLAAAGCSAGLDLTICGTAEWEAKSRGADTTTNRTVTVDFTTEKRFADAAALFDSVELATATVEIASVGEGNAATKVSGKVELGPEDGSQKVLIAEYKDLAITQGGKLELTLSTEGKALAQSLLKSGSHKFKAFITGEIDKAPANLKLRAKFNVVAKVSGGGAKTDLGCVSFGIISDEPAPKCDPNPCQNGGTCTASAEALACTCVEGFSGVKCENGADENLCANVTCDGGQACNPATGQCESGNNPDKCANVQCEGTQTCNPATGTCEEASPGNPTARIVGPTNATAGTELSFSGETSTSPNGEITAYAWDFGDGTTASGAVVSKSYSGAGEFAISLTVTDGAGKTGSTQAVVQIAPAPASCLQEGCPTGFFCEPTSEQCAPDCTVTGCPPGLTCNPANRMCEEAEADACQMCMCEVGGRCFAQCAQTSFCGGPPGPSGESCFMCRLSSCGQACPN